MKFAVWIELLEWVARIIGYTLTSGAVYQYHYDLHAPYLRFAWK